jgi:hypothetical protein
MGKLIFGARGDEVEVDDRVMAHLQAVIIGKLRRNESFLFSLDHSPEHGNGRLAIWVHPHLSLRFSYYGSKRPAMNRAWIEQLMDAANSGAGLRLLPEPAE